MFVSLERKKNHKEVNITGANSAETTETWPVSQTLSSYLAFPLLLSQTKPPFLLLWGRDTENRCPTCVFHWEVPRVTVNRAAHERRLAGFTQWPTVAWVTDPVEPSKPLWLGIQSPAGNPVLHWILPGKDPDTSNCPGLQGPELSPQEWLSHWLGEILPLVWEPESSFSHQIFKRDHSNLHPLTHSRW